MASWPSSLPDFVLRRGYREGFKKLFIRSPMDSGRAKRRRRFTDAPRAVKYPVAMTGNQLDIFKAFYEDTLEGGALSFTWTDPRTSAAITLAFTETPSDAQATGADSYIVILPLEILP